MAGSASSVPVVEPSEIEEQTDELRRDLRIDVRLKKRASREAPVAGGGIGHMSEFRLRIGVEV